MEIAMEQKEYKPRAQDYELNRLAARVEELDKDVQKLRAEFEGHLVIEDKRYREIVATLATLQTKIDQLLVEIKEPLESYKTAKYGISFVRVIVEAVKWLLPLIVGVVIGYGPIRNGIIGAPTTPIQSERTK
jgi:hypothetical protein